MRNPFYVYDSTQGINAFQAGQEAREKRETKNVLAGIGQQAASGDLEGARKNALAAGQFGVANDFTQQLGQMKAEERAYLEEFYDDVGVAVLTAQDEATFERNKQLLTQKYPQAAGLISQYGFQDRDFIAGDVVGAKELFKQNAPAKPPSGFQRRPDGGLEPIPGGPNSYEYLANKPPSKQIVDTNEGFNNKPTPTNVTKAQQVLDEADLTLAMLDDFESVLKNPNTGLVGDIRGIAQGTGQQTMALMQWVSGEADKAIEDIIASESDVSTNMFTLDPTLSAQELLENVLTYRLAKMSDPTGKLSDRDVEEAKKALGFNRSLTGAGDIQARMDQMRRMVTKQQDIAKRRLRVQEPVPKPNGRTALPAGIPAGSVQIGTSNGKPVYEAPDGSRYIDEG